MEKRRIEVVMREQGTGKHIRTVTVQSDEEEITDLLYPVRAPVIEDIMKRFGKSQKKEKIRWLKENTDFFDSKGHDISDEEYYDNEMSFHKRC